MLPAFTEGLVGAVDFGFKCCHRSFTVKVTRSNLIKCC